MITWSLRLLPDFAEMSWWRPLSDTNRINKYDNVNMFVIWNEILMEYRCTWYFVCQSGSVIEDQRSRWQQFSIMKGSFVIIYYCNCYHDHLALCCFLIIANWTFKLNHNVCHCILYYHLIRECDHVCQNGRSRFHNAQWDGGSQVQLLLPQSNLKFLF